MATSTTLVKSDLIDEELPVDLSQLRAIPLRKTLLLVNNFVSNTSRYLNHFSAVCEDKMATISHKLTHLEIQLAILETKLNSIPDLDHVAGTEDILVDDLPAPSAPGTDCITSIDRHSEYSLYSRRTESTTSSTT